MAYSVMSALYSILLYINLICIKYNSNGFAKESTFEDGRTKGIRSNVDLADRHICLIMDGSTAINDMWYDIAFVRDEADSWYILSRSSRKTFALFSLVSFMCKWKSKKEEANFWFHLFVAVKISKITTGSFLW